jgi:cell division protein ZapD
MNTLCFEQGFNEHMRVCLKLDELFNGISHYLNQTKGDQAGKVLESIVHAITLLDRPDFKSKLIKELNRINTIFQRLIHSDKVNQSKLNATLTKLQFLSEKLQFIDGKLVQALRENDFLTSIRSHQGNPGGAWLSEIPCYRLWLSQAYTEQQADVQYFLEHFDVIQQTVSLLMQLVRDSAVPLSKIAEGGFYQMSLDAQLPLQLLRIHLPKQTQFFPEASIGRHGISLRFYPLTTQVKRRSQTEKDVAFQLTICSL